MPREKFQTLTEQMFYTLLCLKDECCGIDILDKVPAMTDRRVSVGSGTLYTLLEQFTEAGMIRETRVEGRRRSYVLTDKGREMLERYVSDGSKNFINFNSAQYDQVMKKALTTLDADEQTQLYKQAQTILNEEAASLWIQDLCDLVVMNPALDGMTFYATYVLDMSTIHYK